MKKIVPAETVTVSAEVTETYISDTDDLDSGDEIEFTDQSPEALLRRAAWNKGLRCRKNYGDHCIPVAFVKSKVAVYVYDEPTAKKDVLENDGWMILKFDAEIITDGEREAAEIRSAVRENTKNLKRKR